MSDTTYKSKHTGTAIDNAVDKVQEKWESWDAAADRVIMQADWNEASPISAAFIKNKPQIPDMSSLARVATTGDYNDLTNKPIETQSDWDESNSGSAAYIKNKPQVPSAQKQAAWDAAAARVMPTINSLEAVAYGTEQNLNASQKARARANIGAGTSDFTGYNLSDKLNSNYIENNNGWTNNIGTVTNIKINNTEYTPDVTGQVVIPINFPTKVSELTNDLEYLTATTLRNVSGIQADWNESNSGSLSYIKNKPNIPDISELADVAISGDYYDLKHLPQIGNGIVSFYSNGVHLGDVQLNSPNDQTIHLVSPKPDWAVEDEELPNAILNKPVFANIAYTGAYSDLSGAPAIGNGSLIVYFNGTQKINFSANAGTDHAEVYLAQVQANWTQSDSNAYDYIKNKPSLAAVATSGAYADLSGRPAINNGVLTVKFNGSTINTFSANDDTNVEVIMNQVRANWAETSPDSYAYIQNKPNLATVATSGSYNDLINKPTYATVASTGSYNDLTTKIDVAELQCDWNEAGSFQPRYIANKPVVETEVSEGTKASLVTNGEKYIWNHKQDALTTSNKLAANCISGLSNVATSGDYDDLTDCPAGHVYLYKDDPDNETQANQHVLQGTCDLTAKSGNDLTISLHKAAFSGSYNDLRDKPPASETGVRDVRFGTNDAEHSVVLDGGIAFLTSDLSQYDNSTSGFLTASDTIDNATNATNAVTATNLASAPSFSTYNTDQIKVTAGGQTSAAFTVPYATEANHASSADAVTALKYYTSMSGTGTANLTVRKATQSAYTSGTKDSNTLYLIVG